MQHNNLGNFFFLMLVLLLFRYAETNSSGDDCHWKKKIVTAPMPCRSTQASTRRENASKGRNGEVG